MLDLWTACGSRARAVEFAGDVLRLVESQEQVATQRLVGNLAEQALLESLLERSKPPLPPAAQGLHYLLATPFRYPPLRYGSRFGRRHESALFYASCSEAALLAEAAYYRCVFWHGMTIPPAEPLRTQHTVFGARVQAGRAYRLDAPPFDEYAPIVASPNDYAPTQALGSALREAAADAVVYPSARDPGRGLNVGLYAPSVFVLPQPTFQQEWLCETATSHVSFRSRSELKVHTLPLAQFLVDGALPTPAA